MGPRTARIARRIDDQRRALKLKTKGPSTHRTRLRSGARISASWGASDKQPKAKFYAIIVGGPPHGRRNGELGVYLAGVIARLWRTRRGEVTRRGWRRGRAEFEAHRDCDRAITAPAEPDEAARCAAEARGNSAGLWSSPDDGMGLATGWRRICVTHFAFRRVPGSSGRRGDDALGIGGQQRCSASSRGGLLAPCLEEPGGRSLIPAGTRGGES